jgi:hypothetical protein
MLECIGNITEQLSAGVVHIDLSWNYGGCIIFVGDEIDGAIYYFSLELVMFKSVLKEFLKLKN